MQNSLPNWPSWSPGPSSLEDYRTSRKRHEVEERRGAHISHWNHGCPNFGNQKKGRDFQWIWWTVYEKTLGALFISKQMGFSGCPIIQFWEKFWSPVQQWTNVLYGVLSWSLIGKSWRTGKPENHWKSRNKPCLEIIVCNPKNCVFMCIHIFSIYNAWFPNQLLSGIAPQLGTGSPFLCHH